MTGYVPLAYCAKCQLPEANAAHNTTTGHPFKRHPDDKPQPAAKRRRHLRSA